METTPRHDIIPEPALRRMPWYLAYVSLLREMKVEYVSSTQISRELKVDPSQIAKDLSFLDIRGKTRIGYEVALLEHKREEFLGFRREHRAVIVGVGSLGGALMQDSGLSRYGLQIVAGFDVDPEITGKNRHGLPVYDVSELTAKVRGGDRHPHSACGACAGHRRPPDRGRSESHMEFHPLPHLCARRSGDLQHLHLCPSGSDVQPHALTPHSPGESTRGDMEKV